jgi:hypothetical protein
LRPYQDIDDRFLIFTRISVIDARTTAEINEKYSGFVNRVPNSCEFMYNTTA